MNQTVLFMVYGAAGAVATYLLQKAGVTAVIASCIIGLVGAFLAYVFKSSDMGALIFIGSFVGMTSLSIGHVSMILIGGAISGIVYSISQTVFSGYGGRMGSIAFISVLTSMGLMYLIQVLLRVLK